MVKELLHCVDCEYYFVYEDTHMHACIHCENTLCTECVKVNGCFVCNECIEILKKYTLNFEEQCYKCNYCHTVSSNFDNYVNCEICEKMYCVGCTDSFYRICQHCVNTKNNCDEELMFEIKTLNIN